MRYSKESLEEMRVKIAEKRSKMIEVANAYGLNSKKTVKYSEEHDSLIIKYQKAVKFE